MTERRAVIAVRRHMDALPVVARLEGAGISTSIEPQQTPISGAANMLLGALNPGARDLPGQLGQHWRVMVAADDFEAARQMLIDAGLPTGRDQL